MGSKKIIIVILIFSNIFSWTLVVQMEKVSNLEVCFFDVGQGDSIFIKTPEKHRILIDGGPDATILKKLSEKTPIFNKDIDLIILTHPHKDHIYGLIEVLKNFKVKNILWTGINYENPFLDEFKILAEKEKANIFIAKKGFAIRFFDNQTLKVIHPGDSLENQIVDRRKINDTSIVLMLDSFGDRMLFTGDISHKSEAALLLSETNLNADILKIAHHGSKSSSAPEFLREVSPSLAVISVSKYNQYNHPSEEVLKKLEKYNIKVERTDKNEDICLIQKKKGQFYLSNQME